MDYKVVEVHAWTLAVERHLRQAFEIYSGDSVQFGYLKIEARRLESDYCDLEVSGVVVGANLADGTSQKFSAWIELTKNRENGWETPSDHRVLQIMLECDGNAYVNGYYYHAAFGARDGKSLLPLVTVCRAYDDDRNYRARFDQGCWAGHHLGDRHKGEFPVPYQLRA